LDGNSVTEQFLSKSFIINEMISRRGNGGELYYPSGAIVYPG